MTTEIEAVLTWGPLVRTLTAGCAKTITPATILAIIYIESGGDAKIINPHGGATGLMQVMPTESNPDVFGDRPTQQELLDPETNILWGIKILKVCLRGNRTLEDALYLYSGGKAWQNRDRFIKLYWQPFLKHRLVITRHLRKDRDG